MNLHPSQLLRAAAPVATACLLLAAGGATAAIGGSAADASITPGGSTTVEFTLDFGAGTQVTSFNFGVFFDATLLELGPVVSVSLPALQADALETAGFYSDARPDGSYTVSWYALDDNLAPLPALSLSGLATIGLSFSNLGLAYGKSTPVSLTLDWTDEAADQGNTVSLVATVNAVPEPQSLALMLAGAGIVASGVARRRRTPR